MATTKKKQAVRAPEGAVYTSKGQPIERTRPYSLSFMAQEHGRGIDGAGQEMGVARFRDVLAQLGVADPFAQSWEVTLPNGHVVGMVIDGKAPTKKAAAPAKKAPAKKAPARKAPAKKAAPTAAKRGGRKPMTRKAAAR